MTLNEFMKPASLEVYSFKWSQVRLIVAAIALFVGGVPPVLFFIPVLGRFSITGTLLKLAWIVSGAASAYLLYRWKVSHKKVFSGRNRKDMIAFFVSIVSGLNLGFVGLTGRNIGMSISSHYFIFILVGILYLWSAVHLFRRWKASGEKVF